MVRMFSVAALGLLLSARAVAQVPDSIRAPAGEASFLHAHASGAQVYVCQKASDGQMGWVLKAPDAVLRNAKGSIIIHHYAGPTWKHKDGSTVTGKAVAHTDSPGPGSIPWLLVTATDHSGTGVLAHVTSVQRIHTKGGLAPAAATCDGAALGKEARSAYSADYYFYSLAK